MSQQAVISQITTSSITINHNVAEQTLSTKSTPSTSVTDSTAEQQNSSKHIATKFKKMLHLFKIHPSTKEPFTTAVPTPRIVDKVYDGEDEQTTREYNPDPFALHLTLEISMDESELDYIRRTQAEEWFQYQRRMLFAR